VGLQRVIPICAPSLVEAHAIPHCIADALFCAIDMFRRLQYIFFDVSWNHDHPYLAEDGVAIVSAPRTTNCA
jgi:hypothetical protein